MLTIKACSVCRDHVRENLARAKVSTIERNVARGTESVWDVALPNPTTLRPNSLAVLCWNKLKFPFHEALELCFSCAEITSSISITLSISPISKDT
ncbi:hypothetical protein VTI74DRAFT_9606 [Chaetomium olivicolor]